MNETEIPKQHTEAELDVAEVAERLEHLEDRVERTYKIIRMQMIWRWVYWGILATVIISGYIYLGPILDTLAQEAKKLLLLLSN